MLTERSKPAVLIKEGVLERREVALGRGLLGRAAPATGVLLLEFISLLAVYALVRRRGKG